jgi:hypothetical protein
MRHLPAVRLSFIAGMAVSCVRFDAAAADWFFPCGLTTSTIFAGVYLAPAGSGRWGNNRALNDKDKAVDPSERLLIKDSERGGFDAKLVDQKGRTCIVRGIDLAKDTTFDVRDTDLTDCHRARAPRRRRHNQRRKS